VPTNARALGMVRAGVCGFFLYSHLQKSYSDLGRLPATVLRPTGLMQLLPWSFYDALLTTTGMLVLKVLLIISLLIATAGFINELATKSSALLLLFYEGLLRSFGHFNHDEMPAVYVLIVLAFSPCGDAFSLDSWLKRKYARAAGWIYGYPILLMRVLLAWSYFTSAIIKLRVAGFKYFSPDSLPTLGIIHSLDNLHDTHYRLAFILPRYRELMPLAIGLVLLWELLFPLAIWSRLARRLILAAGVVFHVGTLFFMNIFFPYHLAMYLVYIDWPNVLKRFERVRKQGEGGKSKEK
jgi:hypothetical protein